MYCTYPKKGQVSKKGKTSGGGGRTTNQKLESRFQGADIKGSPEPMRRKLSNNYAKPGTSKADDGIFGVL